MRFKPYTTRFFLILLIALFAIKPAKAQYCTTNLYDYGCGPYTYYYSSYFGYYSYSYYYYLTDYIQSFSTTGGRQNITNLNTNCAGGNPGYNDYTAQRVVAAVGETVNFTMVNNPDYDEYYTVWIDYNNNGVFTDAGEQVYNDLIAYGGSDNGSFTVPAGTTPGAKRLRVRCSEDIGSATAVDPCANYDFGEVEDYTLLVVGPCDPITNLAASNLTLTDATISWTGSLTSTNYEYKIDNSPSDPTGSGYSFTTSNTLNLTPLTPSTCYYIHVRNICDPNLAETPASPWVTLQFCTVTDCVAPKVTIDNIVSTTARATWDPVPTVYAYEYAVSRLQTPPTTGNSTTYTSVVLQGLEPNKPFWVHVRAKCSPTPVSPWTSVPFHTTAGVGVEDVNKNDFGIETYPNPVKDMLNVKISGDISGKANMVLTDVSGKEITQIDITGNSAEINMKSLPKGVYILKYADGTHYNTVKVIKE